MKLVSVIMPTYNTPYEYLSTAITSILSQSYKNLELIIVDDESTENNDFSFIYKICEKDKRVILIKNKNEKGVAGALNTGLEYAKGEYIFRMDADDIAEVERLNSQITFMDKHENVSILAGYAKCFGDSNEWHKSFRNNTAIKTQFLFQGDLVHPTICFRAQSVKKYKMRYENVQNEDYDLWIHCAVNSDIIFSTLKRKVLNYRVHNKQVTKTRLDILNKQAVEVRMRYLDLLGVKLTEKQKNEFGLFACGKKVKFDKKELKETLVCLSSDAYNNEIFDSKKTFWLVYWYGCLRRAVKIAMWDKNYISLVFFILSKLLVGLFASRPSQINNTSHIS